MNSAGMICDFCSMPGPAWIYPASAHEISGELRSEGAWAACERCSALIEDGARRSLCSRATQLISQHHGLPVAAIRKQVAEAHAGFWRNRRADRIRLSEGMAEEMAPAAVAARSRLGL